MKLDLYQTNLQNWFKLHLGLLLGTYNPEYWSVDYFHFLRLYTYQLSLRAFFFYTLNGWPWRPKSS